MKINAFTSTCVHLAPATQNLSSSLERTRLDSAETHSSKFQGYHKKMTNFTFESMASTHHEPNTTILTLRSKGTIFTRSKSNTATMALRSDMILQPTGLTLTHAAKSSAQHAHTATTHHAHRFSGESQALALAGKPADDRSSSRAH